MDEDIKRKIMYCELFILEMITFVSTVGCGFVKPSRTDYCKKFMACNKDVSVEKSLYHSLIGNISYDMAGTITASGASISLSYPSPSPSAEFEG